MNAISRSLAAVCVLILMPLQGMADERVTVFAAASLKDVLDAASEQWDGDVVVSYGGSGLIARQVAQGAPADIVILANQEWMDWLQAQGTLPDRVHLETIASNQLVVIGPSGSLPLQLDDLDARLGDGRLAIGNTLGVPAGIYGRQWLERAGLWPLIRSRLAETENVRAALALVARGEAPLGVVYASDAAAEPDVDIVHAVLPMMHDPIAYPMLVLDREGAQQANEFASFLRSRAGQALFAQHGFVAMGPSQ
ncbi:molybdate ABC transporter substrate-binding protein [Roseovarius sp. 2305UL8-3]|uniref:molybdate ABC transporter substrate-binding protein n=1 Tax=Roseovarius conchicola TaxID=3121636 RepID=UPI00352972AC